MKHSGAQPLAGHKELYHMIYVGAGAVCRKGSAQILIFGKN